MKHIKNKWYDHTWEGKKWQVEFDLTMLGLGIGWAQSTRSGALILPFFLITYGKG